MPSASAARAARIVAPVARRARSTSSVRPGQTQRQLLAPLEPAVADALDPVGGVRPTEVVPSGGLRVVDVDAVEALRLLAHHAVLAEREAVALGERIRVHVVREGAHCVPR